MKLALISFTLVQATAVYGQNPQDCDYYTDTDCYDGDPCRQFNYNCSSCVDNGCFWCPTDALCYSQAVDATYWDTVISETDTLPSCMAEADYATTCDAVFDDNVFTDPLYDSMKWSYEILNVEEVWRQGITGKGVHVRINDVGVDADHPEFQANFDIENSCEYYLPFNYTTDDHGTATASIVGGNANNGECATGIAPGATLSSCTLTDELNDTETLLQNLDAVDISSNSWGPTPCENKGQRFLQEQECPFAYDGNFQANPCNDPDCEGFPGELTELCENTIGFYCQLYFEHEPLACAEYLDVYVNCKFNAWPKEEHIAFVKASTEGRDGKGVIFVFSAGNEYADGTYDNTYGVLATRFTIAVGAVGKDGKHAQYSNPGSTILVSAPGGDEESASNNIVAKPGGGCHDITVGTSFACPAVSGVIALMLEVNSELGWRDVQAILANTAQKAYPDDTTWVLNAAEISHSYFYGFGVVDAAAAVAEARVWQNLPPEKQMTAASGSVDMTISDDPTEMTSSTAMIASNDSDLFIEAIAVYIDVYHVSRGDLKIVLTSPGGTESILAYSQRPESIVLGKDDRWKFMTRRPRGESPVGEWTLSLVDEKEGVVNDCVDYPAKFLLTEEDSSLFGEEEEDEDDDDETDDDGFEESQLTCSVPVDLGWCTNGTVLNSGAEQIVAEDEDISLADACCICGGGIAASGETNILRSWRMIAYGYDRNAAAGGGAIGPPIEESEDPVDSFPVEDSEDPAVDGMETPNSADGP